MPATLAPPPLSLRSPRALRPVLRAVNAAELLESLAALPGARDAGGAGGAPGGAGDGAVSGDVLASVLVNGVEYARSARVEETRLRAAWKRRQGGGAVPLILISDDPEQTGFVRVLGPLRDGPLRRVRSESLLGLIQRTLSLKGLQARRLLTEELDRLDTERIAGLKVRGLGTEHLYDKRLPTSEPQRWEELERLVHGVSRAGWRELLTDFGYAIESLKPSGYLAKFDGHPTIVIHPRAHAWLFARLEEGRLPEGALISQCRQQGASYGILAAGTRLRLLSAAPQEAGSTTRYLELDAAALEPDRRALLGLLAPPFLAQGGFQQVLLQARDYGQDLRLRLDRVLRQQVLPVLGRELGRWAQGEAQDLAEDTVREELEGAALLFVFRALFLLYAESANHLPMANPTYRAKSLTRVCERAFEERDAPDPLAGALWDDVAALVRRMRTGHTAWDLPAYNGDLFAADAVAGAGTLERASIADAALGPALVALARDAQDPAVGIDFSSLEIGHLGYIYEGLLSLRLSQADRDYAYDFRSDRYLAPGEDVEPDVRAGELLWLTNEGGRKGGGVYYTRTELVRHLVRGAVGPAFDRHLADVRKLAARDPAAAADRVFDFFVLDPACGSAHFLVEVIDEIADKIAALLGEVALPAVGQQLEALRTKAASYGAGIEDTALLKRLVLKRCVYGVDLSAMGVEIAKVSLWLSTFVPGLSLAYLDHNVQQGNSLIGVARAESIVPPGSEHGQTVLFGDELAHAIREAAKAAVKLRGIDDITPDQVAASRAADQQLREREVGALRLFNLWTADPLGVQGARDEALRQGADVLAGATTPLSVLADRLAERESFLHWPMAFPEVFARDHPGFDAVVGNPPWEEVKLEQLAFYALYRPGLRGMPEMQRKQEIESLKSERQDLVERFQVELEHITVLRRYLKPVGGYEETAGDPDLYKYFSQRYRQLLGERGRLGVVLPRTVFQNKGSGGFRVWLFSHAAPSRIDFLVNNRLWAFDTHPQYTVALLVAERRNPQPGDIIEVAGVAKSARDFQTQCESSGLQLVSTALGPNLEIPLLPNQAAANLLTKLRSGIPVPYGSRRWQCFSVREFDETNDARLWQEATGGYPLWKGESFDQYAPHGAEARICPPSEDALARARKKRPGAGSVLASELSVEIRRRAVERSLDRARVAYRLVSRATDSRTLRACLIPPNHFLSNSAPYLAFVDDSACCEAAALGILNSLPFDWQARRFVEANVNFFTLEGLHMPVLDDATFYALAANAARLSCVDKRFADFAKATGVEYGPLKDEEREALRADIDARVAHAWNLTAEELEVVFSDFTLDAVPSDYRDRVRARFAEFGQASR